MEKKQHLIRKVLPGSIAQELEIEAGDRILSVNDKEIEDVFDYQFLMQDTYVELLVEKPDGEQWLLEVEKEPEEDLGIEFENGLMDEYRHCCNRCVFCFIDQMPPGMRETLYFKDDDSRLSFLQGNYVTLTNMSEHDIDRICRYRLSPINISFQTMNPKLRCRMLNNRFAGEALKKVDRLYEAGIRMNGQIVLCKGLNDGEELRYSIGKLTEYIPILESVSVVPVGLTKYREGLYPLEPFTGEEAGRVIDMIEAFQRECFAGHGIHFVHASDEWYVLAGRKLPEEERYDGYLQLENGVGMLRLLTEEFKEAIEMRLEEEGRSADGREDPEREGFGKDRHILYENRDKSRMSDRELGELQGKAPKTELSIATGRLPYPYIRKMADVMTGLWPELEIHVYPIVNHFFGENITVSGLITGRDLLDQLKGRPLGRCLFLPENVLRSGEEVFLDDMTVKELENALQVPVNIVKSSGNDFVRDILEMRECPQEAGREV